MRSIRRGFRLEVRKLLDYVRWGRGSKQQFAFWIYKRLRIVARGPKRSIPNASLASVWPYFCLAVLLCGRAYVWQERLGSWHPMF